MFECSGTASVLKRVIESISELLIECQFDCDEHGMNIQSMDASHVCLASVNLLPEGFLMYECPQPTVIGFSVKPFKNILKCAGPDDKFTLRYNNDSVLLVLFEPPSGGKVTDFSLKLMDIEQEAMSVPEMVPDMHLQMNSNELKRIVNDLSNFGDSIGISGTKDGVTFSVDGDTGTGNITINPVAPDELPPNDPGRSVEMDMRTPVCQNFSVRYLTNFLKNAAGDIVVIDMVVDMPMCLKYPLRDTGSVKFYLAPKIDD